MQTDSQSGESKSDKDAILRIEKIIEGFESYRIRYSKEAYGRTYTFIDIDGMRLTGFSLPDVIMHYITKYQENIDNKEQALKYARACRKYLIEAYYKQFVIDSDDEITRKKLANVESELESIRLAHEQLQEQHRVTEEERNELKSKYAELKENFDSVTRTCPKCNFNWQPDNTLN